MGGIFSSCMVPGDDGEGTPARADHIASHVVVAHRRVDLTDVLFLVSANGFGSIVARGACAVNKQVWNDAVLWRTFIDELFGRDCETGEGTSESEHKKTRLYLAIENGGSDDLVKKWIDFGANLDRGDLVVGKYSTNEYNIPLVAAIRDNKNTLAKLLLGEGANPNKMDARSWSSPLKMAAIKGNRELFRLLVEKFGAGLMGSSTATEKNKAPDDTSPLLDEESVYCNHLDLAIRHRHFKLVDMITKRFLVSINYFNEDYEVHNSYVESAIASNSLKMLKKVLKLGSVVNYENYENSEVPLVSAVEANNSHMVELLLDHGADANLALSYGQKTPLICAADNNNVSIAKMLIKAGAAPNAAITYEGDFNDFVDQLEEGMSPLHYFAQNVSPVGVSLMLMSGAECDALTFSGMSALLLLLRAVSKVNEEDDKQELVEKTLACLVLLSAGGANFNLRRDMADIDWDWDGDDEGEEEFSEALYSPAMYAVKADAPALIKSLAGTFGASVCLVAASSRSTLMLAAELGFADSMRTVLSAASVQLESKDMKIFVNLEFRNQNDEEDMRNGRTALAFCLGSDSSSEMMQMLLEAGADPRHVDDAGLTVRDIAFERGYHSLVSLLDNFKKKPLGRSEKFKFQGLTRGFWSKAEGAFTTSETSSSAAPAPAPAASMCWIPLPSEVGGGLFMGLIALQAAGAAAAAAAAAEAEAEAQKK